MRTMDNEEYQKIRNYCVSRNTELNDTELTQTRIKADKNEVFSGNWVIQEMHNQEIRREAYAKVVELLDGKTDFTVSEIQNLVKVFQTKHALNRHHLAFYKALSRNPSRQPFDADHIIRKIEMDEEMNTAIIRLCEDVLSER